MRLAKQSQFIPVQNAVYFISLPFLVRIIFTFYANDVLLFNVLSRAKGLNTSEEEEDYSSKDVRHIYRNYSIQTSILREADPFSATKKRILVTSLQYLISIGSK